MSILSEKERQRIIEILKSGEDMPLDYKHILFPPEKKEYELVYAGKEREEDILANTMAVPLQPIKTFGKNGDDWTNKLIFGDNLQVMKSLLDDPNVKGRVKLIYIDPPFATKQEFRGSQDQKAYQDKIVGAKFIEFLRKRLVFLKELLADDGSIYVHLDWKKVHYVKTVMDEIFRENNFLNELIWAYKERETSKRFYNRKHETILFYAKLKNSMYPFHGDLIREDYSEVTINKFKLTDKEGRKYRLRGKDGTSDPPYESNDTYRQYLDKASGPLPRDWFIIPFVNQAAEERNGYPTQKPESLLERIIKASSNKFDIVLDVFAGSGTTLAVAEKLGRRWIGIDCGKLAIYTMQKRLHNLKSEIGNKGKKLKPKPFTLYHAGLYEFSKLKQLPWKDWRLFALHLFNCRDSKHTVSGIELDGYRGRSDVLVFNYQQDGGGSFGLRIH